MSKVSFHHHFCVDPNFEDKPEGGAGGLHNVREKQDAPPEILMSLQAIWKACSSPTREEVRSIGSKIFNVARICSRVARFTTPFAPWLY